jgi:hypothetical protein
VGAPAAVAAQSSSALGTGPITAAGYTPVIPEALIGLGAFHMFGETGRWGIFADWKMTPGSLRNADNFRGGLSAVGPSDGRLRTTDEWQVVNAGILRTVTGDMAVLLGWGVARRQRFHEFVDLVQEGSYFVEDADASGNRSNPVVGLLFRGGHSVAFRFGLEGGPKRLSGGIYLMHR